VVIRDDDEPCGLAECAVLGKLRRIDVAVRAHNRQGRRSLVQRACQPPNRGVGIEVAIFLHHTPLNPLKPPSTGTTTPVTKEAASLQSQCTGPINSSARPNRPIGVRAMTVLPRGVWLPS